MTSGLLAGEPVTRGASTGVDDVASATGGVKEHFFLLRVDVEDESASETTASPSRRGCKLAIAFESIERAEAEQMIRNDRASAVNEWKHEDTFMTTTPLKRKTEGNDAERNETLEKQRAANPWSLLPYWEASDLLTQFRIETKHPVPIVCQPDASREGFLLRDDIKWSASWSRAQNIGATSKVDDKRQWCFMSTVASKRGASYSPLNEGHA